MLAEPRISFPGSAGIHQSIGSWAKMSGKWVTMESQRPTADDGFASSDPSNSVPFPQAPICVVGGAGKIGVMQARDPSSFVSLLMQAWCFAMLLFALTCAKAHFMSCCYGRETRSPLLGLGALVWALLGLLFSIWIAVAAGVWLTVSCCPGLWEGWHRKVSSHTPMEREKKRRLLSFVAKKRNCTRKPYFMKGVNQWPVLVLNAYNWV